MRQTFPEMNLDFIYVPGAQNLADGRSRGTAGLGGADEGVAESLRRLMGISTSAESL